MMSFLEEVNAHVNGAPLQRCYHCRKCTAGCPVAVAMDYKPNAVVRMVQQGQRQFDTESGQQERDHKS